MMAIRSILFPKSLLREVLSLAGILLLAALASGCAAPVENSTAPATEVIRMPTPAAEVKSWVLLDDPADDATQVEIGGEVYRLVCSTCHGDRGQGLTDAWRATLFPENQNCWQSKCHASNHPPDGFVLPKEIPPVTGEQIAARFLSAKNLYDFVRVTMPYHVPGTMLDEEYWQVTAYLLALNGIDMGDTVLDASNAREILLR